MTEAFRELQKLALCLMQALIGVISSNFRMVSLTRQSQTIVVQIVLATHSDEDAEEIEDLRTEFWALLPHPANLQINVIVSQEPITLEPPNESSITVFRRREALL